MKTKPSGSVDCCINGAFAVGGTDGGGYENCPDSVGRFVGSEPPRVADDPLPVIVGGAVRVPDDVVDGVAVTVITATGPDDDCAVDVSSSLEVAALGVAALGVAALDVEPVDAELVPAVDLEPGVAADVDGAAGLEAVVAGVAGCVALVVAGALLVWAVVAEVAGPCARHVALKRKTAMRREQSEGEPHILYGGGMVQVEECVGCETGIWRKLGFQVTKLFEDFLCLARGAVLEGGFFQMLSPLAGGRGRRLAYEALMHPSLCRRHA
jgi:hypothetical protein